MKLHTDSSPGDVILIFFYKSIYPNCTTTISALLLFLFKLDYLLLLRISEKS